MNNNEGLKELLTSKDKMFEIYDEMRFNYEKYDHSLFMKLKETKENLDNGINKIVKNNEECLEIVVLNQEVIEREEKREIKTNLTGYKEDIIDKIMFDGFIPSAGYLKLSCEYLEDKGMTFYVENKITQEMTQNFSHTGSLNSPDTTWLIEPGIYFIKKDMPIAIAFINKSKVKENGFYELNEKTKESISNFWGMPYEKLIDMDADDLRLYVEKLKAKRRIPLRDSSPILTMKEVNEGLDSQIESIKNLTPRRKIKR